MELHGVTGKPYDTPQVRKKMPDPFQRPRINLDGGARQIKRSWKDTSVLDVRQGDTVAQFGTVVETKQTINLPLAGAVDLSQEPVLESDTIELTWRVRLYNVMGDYKDFPGEQRVFAFTADAVDD